MGHTITPDGCKSDEKKVEAIIKMPPPNNAKEVKSFLGMANYLSKFIPNLSNISEPLRILDRKEVQWHWEDQQEKAFQ